jgi:uncharacterized protein (TIGR03118 family)
MRSHSFARRRLALGVLLTLAAALALGAAVARSDVPGTYTVHALVSNQSSEAGNPPDTNLQNGWGIAAPPTGPWWVSDNGTDKSTLYTASGAHPPPPAPQVVNILNGAPTGVVFNGGSGFPVTGSGGSGPARFIFAAESGTISGWNPTADFNNSLEGAIVPGAVFKGLALASNNGAPQLYATDFAQGDGHSKVDVFNSSWGRGTASGGFVDPNLPNGYAPFGIQNVGGNHLVVTFAKQEAGSNDEQHHQGFGVADMFDSDGNLLSRIATHGQLNAPWGIAMAPANFGPFGGDLLIGNFGDGQINAYAQQPDGSWERAGGLRDSQGRQIAIDGLWGIGFGNNATAGPSTTLYFAAGPNDENDGLFGSITAN